MASHLWEPHLAETTRVRDSLREVTCWNDAMETISFRGRTEDCGASDHPYSSYNEAAAVHNENKLRHVYAHDTLPVRNRRMREQTDAMRDKRNVAVERIRLGEHQHAVFEKGLLVLGIIYYVMVVLVVVRLGYMLHESGGPEGGGLLDARNRTRVGFLLFGGLFFLALPLVSRHVVNGSYAWWKRDVPEASKTLGLRPGIHPTSANGAGGAVGDHIPDDYIRAQREAAVRAIQ
jgi:hypothetical protein